MARPDSESPADSSGACTVLRRYARGPENYEREREEREPERGSGGDQTQSPEKPQPKTIPPEPNPPARELTRTCNNNLPLAPNYFPYLITQLHIQRHHPGEGEGLKLRDRSPDMGTCIC